MTIVAIENGLFTTDLELTWTIQEKSRSARLLCCGLIGDAAAEALGLSERDGAKLVSLPLWRALEPTAETPLLPACDALAVIRELEALSLVALRGVEAGPPEKLQVEIL